ncbi:MAG: riboflavin synthase [Hyphomicrobiaceae bacterium]|nr:MAG: riboflavin synthase [Hyphomicrobiaceae bacterium]
MFTGLISDVGTVEAKDGGRFEIATAYPAKGIAIGASIACDGCCLTAVGVSRRGSGALLTVDVSNETMSKTTLGGWLIGRRVNLERPLKAGDEIGGHLVSGHVDGVARILDRREDGASIRFRFEAPQELARLIAPKGSVALDGTSLTVNEVEGAQFGVNIIPHTAAVTTWGERRAGETVNLEVDVLARYVARLLQHPAGRP